MDMKYKEIKSHFSVKFHMAFKKTCNVQIIDYIFKHDITDYLLLHYLSI